jgi:hypothetical protein
MALAFIDDLRNFCEQHAAELEHAGQAVDFVASNPLAQAVANAAHIPPSLLAGLADLIGKLDAHLAQAAASHAQAVMDAHAQGAAEAAAAAAEPEQQAS